MAIEPLPAEVDELEVDGLKLRYERHGEGQQTLLFLSGVGFARLYWRPLMSYLGSDFRCLLLDSRGCGESQAPADQDDYAMPRLGADALALLDHVGCERAWLVGHSLGANVAIAAAALAPDRIAGLTLISLAVGTDSIAAHLEEVLRDAPAEQLRIVKEHEARGPFITAAGMDERYGLAAGTIYQPYVIKTPVSNALAWAMAQAPAPTAALWGTESAFRVTGLMRDIDQRPLLSKLAMPVVIIAGEDDSYAAPSVALCRKELPDARVVLLSHSGHHGHVEEPARVADAIRDLVAAPAQGSSPRLRYDVELRQEQDQLLIEDHATEYRFAVGEIEATIVTHLGRPTEGTVAAVLEQLGDGYEAEQVAEAVADFVADLSSRGLLAEGHSLHEILRRQRAARLSDRDEERWQSVQQVLHHAATRVPFYRARLAEAGVELEELEDLEDLTRVPPTTKADVRANFPDRMVPDGVDLPALIEGGELTVGATSGTTDERLQVLFDFRIGGLPEHHRALWGLDEGPALEHGAVFTTPLCAGFECHLGTTSMQERTRGATLTLNSSDDVMALREDEVRAIVGELSAYAPQLLFVNPWYGVCLLQRVAELDLRLPPLQAVLSSYQYLTLRHRKLLRAGFGTPVFSYYGATDLGGSLIGVECDHGAMHVREDHVHLELTAGPGLDDAEELGLVTVTTLNNPNFPLLRYQVGDIARCVDQPCSCQLGPEWACFVLEGRLKDCLRSTSGALVTTRQVDLAIGDADLDFYSLLQLGPDRYRLEAVPAADGDPDAVMPRLRALLGDRAEIELKRVRHFSPERSLKFRQTAVVD